MAFKYCSCGEGCDHPTTEEILNLSIPCSSCHREHSVDEEYRTELLLEMYNDIQKIKVQKIKERLGI